MGLFRAKPGLDHEVDLTPEAVIPRVREIIRFGWTICIINFLIGCVFLAITVPWWSGLAAGSIGYGLVIVRAGMLRRHKALHQTLRNDKWMLPMRLQVWYLTLIPAVLYSFFFLSFASFDDDGASSKFGFDLLMFGTWIGGALAWLGRFGRQPGPISCSKCEYDLSAFEERPWQCPECGSVLSTAFTTNRVRARNHYLMAFGLAMMAFAAGGGWMLMSRPGMVLGAAPTRLLMNRAVTSDDAFAELTARPLSFEQHAELVDRLLDERERDEWFWGDQSDWLATQLVNEKLSPSQVDRYFKSMLKLALDGPSEMRTGETAPIRLRLVSEMRARPLTLFVGFAGFQTPDTESPIDQRTRLLYTVAIWNDNLRPHRSGDFKKSPSLEYTPHHPGTHTIQAWCVIAIYDNANPAKDFAWDEDGQPVFAEQPVATREIELEHTIEVAG